MKLRIANIKWSYVLLIFTSILALFPFYMMLVMGTYRSEDLFKSLPLFFSNYFLKNLQTVMKGNFLQSYLNSIIVSFVSVAACLFTSICIAFAIAKYQFRFKGLLMNLILIGMMFPAQISIIGYVIEMRHLHLSNTLLSVILIWIANPFSAFFMTQFIKTSIPDEMLDSARIDGASEPRILVSIVIPCIRAGCITIITLVFLWSWNNYLLPLISLNKASVYTLPLMISNISVAYRQDYGAQMLALALSTFPVLLLFSLGSKYFIKGIMLGSIKG